MKGRICYVMIVLQLVSLVSATSRPFAPHDVYGVPQQGTVQSPESSRVTLGSEQKGFKSMEGMAEMNARGMSKIGSSPPSCEHKCFGCSPCEAIQVPTSSSHVGVQYANYEPEGWKCKCGPSFYSP
ncbi:hypothetical protein L1049_004483 [Liquidambar formosana]|uniref:Epidermal patterning factor-like protein n=1 Tax=Liquidambar formosana TaxID=63359 RepID=A0AAP0RPC1_LIQFO